MSETRTPKQIAADQIETKMFVLAIELRDFDATYGDRSIRDAGDIVSSLRTRVRVHMHPRDREEAN
jgi:hypothetical protein